MCEISILRGLSVRLAGSLLIGALIGCGPGGGGSGGDSTARDAVAIEEGSPPSAAVSGSSLLVEETTPATGSSSETVALAPVIPESIPATEESSPVTGSSTVAEEPSPELADQPTSTALSDNTLVNDYGFEQFTTHNLRLDIATYSSIVSGDYVVARLTDDENNTYFLGIPAPGDELVLSLSLPRYITRLWFELYTNDPNDAGLVEEIIL